MTKINVLLFAIGIALGLSACTTTKGPARDHMLKEAAGFELPAEPDSSSALVYVARPSAQASDMRFHIFLNDKLPASEMGSTVGNQYIYFFVPPGEHTIYSKSQGWVKKTIQARAGQTIFLLQEPGMGFIDGRAQLQQVEFAQGKYSILKTHIGRILQTRRILQADGGLN